MGVKQGNRNRHLGLLILLGFILIIADIVAYIIISYNSDQADIKKRMAEVETGYNAFKEDTDKFNDIRDNIYNSVMQDMYYETLKNNDSTYKSMFQEYKSILESIDKDYDAVKDKCINVLYPDVGTNNKCEALISGYEEIVNLYVSDVTSYNNNITSYNDWLKTNNSTDTPLELVELNRDYIDVNGDREYNGKKESQTELIDSTEGEAYEE